MKITRYFGFQIRLNQFNGHFHVGTEGTAFQSATLQGCKDLIDEFRANNDNFTPFQMLDFTYSRDLPAEELVTVLGVNKEGRFIIQEEDEDGYVGEDFVPPYDEKDYVLPSPETTEAIERMKIIDAQVDRLIEEAKVIRAALPGKTLADVRKENGIVDAYTDTEEE